MPRTQALVAVLTLALVVSGGALVIALRPAPEARVGEAAPAGPEAAAPVRAVALKARAGRVLGFDEAVRELNLIRPSRRKLAEDFGAPLLDGRRLELSAQRGKTVMINFWATWCPPCREEMPAMERLWRHHQDQGFVMLAVSVDSVTAKVKPFVAEHALTFPVLLDPAMDVANAYGVRALPSTFLVDRRGYLTALALGPRRWDNDAAHSLVEAMLRR
ncbi:MAG: hypothetical protein A2W08_12050 [Candidatus Rokubacteria bacterium RBG_16_73_20]|nr:MAG: hypothetical protein A2050_13795 [Candidatus Rokubacteria bacterium GWA2_73_35]OGK96992.1 MAG: hypothetical protein A2W08_12050 [Candidatus Rokubacteria bacterium RBG_16_73_20]HBH01350.1 hypothetical protein [Candidatus Rokubacteria bacterium]